MRRALAGVARDIEDQERAGLDIITATDMLDGARKAVEAAGRTRR